MFIPKALNELLPEWKDLDVNFVILIRLKAPLTTPVTKDKFLILTEKSSFAIPNMFLPKSIHNSGNYIISLGNLCSWLGERAEELGVDILPGIAGDRLSINKDGHVEGVITGDFGIAKDGS